MNITNGSIKRCRDRFNYPKIGKAINTAINLITNDNVEVVISEFIYDYDNELLYNVILFY